MDDGSSRPLPGAAKRFVHRLLAIGENRFQLLVAEVQEERDRVVSMVFLAVITASLGILVGIVLSAALVIFLWKFGPVWILLILGAIYGVAALVLCRRLSVLRQQQTLAATLEQFRKDRKCLKRN